MKKRVLSFLLVLVFLCSMVPMSVDTAYAVSLGVGDWSNGYAMWSQNQSKYTGMYDWGCFLVAKAKMLVEAGI